MIRKTLFLILSASFVVLLTSIGLYIYLKQRHRPFSAFQTVGEYVQEGKYEEAKDLLEEIIRKYPGFAEEHAEAHAALGMIYNKKNLYDEALAELHSALNINPDLANIYQELYKIYKKKGMEKEAQKALDSYEKLKGED